MDSESESGIALVVVHFELDRFTSISGRVEPFANGRVRRGERRFQGSTLQLGLGDVEMPFCGGIQGRNPELIVQNHHTVVYPLQQRGCRQGRNIWLLFLRHQKSCLYGNTGM